MKTYNCTHQKKWLFTSQYCPICDELDEIITTRNLSMLDETISSQTYVHEKFKGDFVYLDWISARDTFTCYNNGALIVNLTDRLMCVERKPGGKRLSLQVIYSEAFTNLVVTSHIIKCDQFELFAKDGLKIADYSRAAPGIFDVLVGME